MEKDVGNAKTNLNVSESKRVELQEHIKTTTIQISEDASRNKQFQDGLIAENKRLLDELHSLKERMV